jgi:hypothetical protein
MKLYAVYTQQKAMDLFDHILFSYHDVRRMKDLVGVLNKYPSRKFFLDSGAFSAFTQGIRLDIDEYIAFIRQFGSRFEVVAGLDVIGDWKASAENYRYMKAAGVPFIPTFHYKSPLEELDRLLDEYEYIALGGLVPIARHRERMRTWLDRCFGVIMSKTHTGTGEVPKVHGFGVNAAWAWRRYPFYSVDATSWLSAGKFGDTSIYHEGRMQIVRGTAALHYEQKNTLFSRGLIASASEMTRLWASRGISWA